MKKSLMILPVLCMAATSCLAGPKQTGTVISQTSVACGEKKSKKQSLDLLCHEYVIRAGSVDYTVRQAKPEDKTVIPLNTPVEFKLDKSKMKVKAIGESFQFLIVSQAAAGSAPPAGGSEPNN